MMMNFNDLPNEIKLKIFDMNRAEAVQRTRIQYDDVMIELRCLVDPDIPVGFNLTEIRDYNEVLKSNDEDDDAYSYAEFLREEQRQMWRE